MRKRITNVTRGIIRQIKKPIWSILGIKISGRQCISSKAKLVAYGAGTIELCGKNTVEDGTLINADGGKVCLNGCYINRNCTIVSQKEIIVENGASIGPNVCIYDHDHNLQRMSTPEQPLFLSESVKIEKSAWIGANATILKGVTVGEGAVVAAGAVVTKDIPPYSIAGGVPAKVIKHCFNEKSE